MTDMGGASGVFDDLAEARSLIGRGEYEPGLSHLVEAGRVAVAQGKAAELREIVELAGIVSRHSEGRSCRRSEDLLARAEQRLSRLAAAAADESEPQSAAEEKHALPTIGVAEPVVGAAAAFVPGSGGARGWMDACPACGHRNPDGAGFCAQCAAPLPPRPTSTSGGGGQGHELAVGLAVWGVCLPVVVAYGLFFAAAGGGFSPNAGWVDLLVAIALFAGTWSVLAVSMVSWSREGRRRLWRAPLGWMLVLVPYFWPFLLMPRVRRWWVNLSRATSAAGKQAVPSADGTLKAALGMISAHLDPGETKSAQKTIERERRRLLALRDIEGLRQLLIVAQRLDGRPAADFDYSIKQNIRQLTIAEAQADQPGKV